MRVTLASSGAAVTLSPDRYVAEGGEGKVFAHDGVAYKLYHDPAQMIPAGKLKALQRLTDPAIVAPLDTLLDPSGDPVGYSMRHVQDAHPLCRLFASAFQQRHGVSPRHLARLAEALRQALSHVHAHGALVVDLNELNILVAPRFDAVALIDVDSWQVPGHPATALQDSIRDRHTAGFDTGTDWFAYAVITFQLFVGVHPYRGGHPSLKGLDARMQADVSVLDPAVSLPPAARPLSALPPALAGWYAAVFQARHRGPPPPVLPGAAIHPVAAIPDGRAVAVEAVWTAPEPIEALVEHLGRQVALTATQIWLDGRPVGPRPEGHVVVGFAGRDARPVLAWRDGDRVSLRDLERRVALPCDLGARALSQTTDGRILALAGDSLVELRLHAVGHDLIAAPRILARVRPGATELFAGVAIERLPGGAQALVSRAAGQITPVALPRGTVLDAWADGDLLAVNLRQGDHPLRLIARLGPGAPDLQTAAGEPLSGALCLPQGVAVLADADGLELMPSAPRAPGRRRITDPALEGGLRLVRLGDRLGALRGATLYRLRLR